MPRHPTDATELVFSRLLRTTKLRSLQIAAVVAELGSLQKAAQALKISQPAATKAVADLEELLGLPLFERHARGMRVTPAGQEILPFVRRVITDSRECALRAINHRLGAVSTLRVAAVAAGVTGLLADALGDFARRCPQVALEVIESDIFGMSTLLSDAAADLFICRHPGQVPQGYEFEELLDDAHVLVASAHHALAEHAWVDLEQLARHEWLLPPNGVPAREIFEDLWAEAGRAAPAVCRISTRSPLLTAALVERLGLIAVLPFSIARPWLQAGTLVRLRYEALRGLGPMGALWRPGGASNQLSDLLDSLRRSARSSTRREVGDPQAAVVGGTEPSA